jgi:hypothetical protein
MGETILVKVGRNLILFLGVLLALYAGFLSLFLLAGFIYSATGFRLPRVGFLVGAIGYAIVVWGFVRANRLKVLGGLMIIAGALLVAPWGILAREPNIVGWMISNVGIFLVAGALSILLGLKAKKRDKANE